MPHSLSIDELLEQCVALGASDLHVTVGSPPVVRVRGKISRRSKAPSRSTPKRRRPSSIASSTPSSRSGSRSTSQIDLAHEVPGVARFRVNVYFQRETLGAALRQIPQDIKSLEELGLPATLHELTTKPRGLVLVTGPTGSGKSTTLAALIDEINRTRSEHILTIEDPVEFVHQHKRCIVNQREIGVDATGFGHALRAALRQDPDVILLGEMRDLETIATALTAAETGHLVFGTLHTQSAPSTIDRVIDVFPAEQQQQVRTQLASTLQGVVTQTLLPTADGAGRVAALEILFPDDAVRNLIRQGKVEQVYSVMQTNTSRGMQTLEQSLADLTMRRVITKDVAMGATSRPEQFEGLLERVGFETRSDAGASRRRRVAAMSEQKSIWKKEISFTRKPKAPKAAGSRRSSRSSPSARARSARPRRRSSSASRSARRSSRRRRVSNNGSAELLNVARRELEPGIVVGGELRDPERLSEALREFFAKNDLPKRNVRLGVANNRIGVRTFEIAGVDDPSQLDNAVRFRAQETLPIPIEDAVLDYHVLSETKDENGQSVKRILLVVAYRDLVDRYVAACRKAGIELAGIDLEAFALLRAMGAPRETQAGAALVVVSVGHDRSTFAVSDGRVCEFARVLEWGGNSLNVALARALDVAPSETEQLKRAARSRRDDDRVDGA